MEVRIFNGLRRLNRGIALLVGLGLLGCAGFVLLDIILRQFDASFGGTEEIAGYAMALATAWGMGFALMELAHVRIDLVRVRMGERLRAILDVLSMVVMSGVIVAIAIKAWPVVERAIENGSRANTPLGTPLAWVQVPWFAGWVWFACMCCAVTLLVASMLVRGQFAQVEASAGAFAEQDALK